MKASAPRLKSLPDAELERALGSKREHHYVPQLYLRHFASQPKRINVYRINNPLARQDVGLKEQCRRARFHGRDNRLEDALADLEGTVAPVLTSVIRDSRLPRPGTTEHARLMLFIALQGVRTPKSIANLSAGMKQMVQLSFGLDSPRGKQLLGSEHDSIAVSLSAVKDIAPVYSSLGQHLLLNRGPVGFITSDNPTVRYNQYCEGITDHGDIGARSKGLLVFTPISPRHLVLLYDKDVYKVGEVESVSTEVSSAEAIDTLNSLQVVFGDEVLLFSQWADLPSIEALVQTVSCHRTAYQSHAEEYVDDNNPKHSSLLHLFERIPNLGLTLPFLDLRRLASKVPLQDRIVGYRETPADKAQPRPSDRSGPVRRFRKKRDGE